MPKPSAELEQVYVLNLSEPEPHTIIRYRTKYGKIFEREECKSRGVVWYQVTQQ